MLFLVVSLIIAVAAFNLVSSLVMLVTDKQADIAILRTLGMSPNTVMRVFVIQGALIGLVGILGGVLAGVLLTLNLDSVVAAIESSFQIDLMPKDVYYITGVPTALRAAAVTLIAVVARSEARRVGKEYVST